MKYKKGDRVEFIIFSHTVCKGEIISIKGWCFKRYRILYYYKFSQVCEWIKKKDIIRIAKEG